LLPARRIFLIDEDVIIKLARCNLIATLPRAYATPHQNFWVRKSSRRICEYKLQSHPQARTAATAFLKLCPEYVDASGAPVAERISGPGIDPGEAVMLGFLAVRPDVQYLTTGDMNALCSLGAAAPEVAAQCRGRIRCFEQALLGCLGCGLPQPWSHYMTAGDCDTVLQDLVARATQSDQFEVMLRAGLGRRVRELQVRCGGLLDETYPPGVFA
jgi:hypothetical protein